MSTQEAFEPATTTRRGRSTMTRWWLFAPAIVVIWTQEQWADLKDRPKDAQLHPTGVWCALRME